MRLSLLVCESPRQQPHADPSGPGLELLFPSGSLKASLDAVAVAVAVVGGAEGA